MVGAIFICQTGLIAGSVIGNKIQIFKTVENRRKHFIAVFIQHTHFVRICSAVCSLVAGAVLIAVDAR